MQAAPARGDAAPRNAEASCNAEPPEVGSMRVKLGAPMLCAVASGTAGASRNAAPPDEKSLPVKSAAPVRGAAASDNPAPQGSPVSGIAVPPAAPTPGNMAESAASHSRRCFGCRRHVSSQESH
eukprot:TRINITY_DN11419_c0_g1_i1.p1 TRINITY_DN11419_c0_g1~~TRINITY_DN11419_c0_g1_i1.p1  ORF type:complete len:124 (-),score=1.23 TRINITY_DN11419_c0_g1_i1:344-715(-)